MKTEHVKAFHDFLKDTVYKGATITQVDSLYLRGRDKVSDVVDGKELLHYGKQNSQFRIFGYYSKNMFVLCRIDGGHKFHG